MGWFVTLLRYGLHALQLGGAIGAIIFYTATYYGVTKDHRWNFAITTSAFSIAGTVIQAIFRFYSWGGDGAQELWTLLSGFCSGILFLFWTGVLGAFAKTFIHRDPTGNYGIFMMRIAVYVDAANMFIWFLTCMDMLAELISADNRRQARTRAANEAFGPNSATPFVPYGWDTADIEAHALALQIENSMNQPTTEMQVAPLSTPLSILPALPPPVVTTESSPTIAHPREIEEGIPISDLPPLVPEELQNFLLMPSLGSPETLDWPLQELRLSGFQKTQDIHNNSNGLLTSTSSEPPESSQSNVSWPLADEWDEPTRECPICCEERPSWTGFPFRISKACSDHEQESCRQCIDRSIMVELDSTIFGSIHCAECKAELDYEEVKALASPITFVQYERMGLRGFVSNDPNFVWCQNKTCPYGQEHVGGVDQPIVTCRECGFKTCFKHQIPWHEEMLCDEYDLRIQASTDERKSRTLEELASVSTIHKVTKPCANKLCRAPIEKTAGCDHMSCFKCKHEFCWVCGENWKGEHRLGCGFR